MKKNKVLVTGAAGFLGAAFFAYLEKKKRNVVGVDIKKSAIKNISKVDLLQTEKIEKFLKKERPDFIFHLAGGRVADEMDMFTQNIKTTESLINAIEAIEDYNPLVIIAGSAAEYGLFENTRKRINEKLIPQPNSLYGKIKLSQTNLALDYYQMGFRIVVARIFNIIGPKTPISLVAGSYASRLQKLTKSKGIKKIITKNLDAKRDFVDIRDVCAALDKIAESGKEGNIYNICSGQGVTVGNLLDEMIKVAKAKDIIVEEESIQEKAAHSIGSFNRLNRLTKWKPKVSLKQSIKDTLQTVNKSKS